jgi:hypothetical protein
VAIRLDTTLTGFVLALWVKMLGCSAFECRYYDSRGEDRKYWLEIMETQKGADRVLSFWDPDYIEIMQGSAPHAGGRGIDSPRGMFFTRDQVKNVAKSDPSKRLLVLWLQKSIMWQGEGYVQNTIKQLQPFVRDLGDT